MLIKEFLWLKKKKKIPFNKMNMYDLKRYFIDRNLESARNNFNIQFSAIDICYKEKFFNPVLILIYTTIDTFSYLDRIDDSEKVVDRFTRWVDNFLLPNSELKCSSIDLYAARCGMVHSSTAESDLSKKGKAKQIYYLHGIKDTLSEHIKILKRENTICVVSIPKLYIALRNAHINYLKYLRKDYDRMILFVDRVNKIMAEDNKEEMEFISKQSTITKT